MKTNRYQRQMLLPGFGEEAQKKLLGSKILVIGAGGLGCPVLTYLAAVGVGGIGIIDHDIVELHNLHRQVLFSEADLGKSKAKVAAYKLGQLNSEINIYCYDKALTTENVVGIFKKYDLIIDGSDNFPTRYLVNDACVLMGKTLVYGSIYRYEGQVAVFNQRDESGEELNYRDLFPNPPQAEEVPNCAEAGVMGVLPGIIGTMMANEAIKIITGLGKPLANRLLTYNTLNNESYTMYLSRNEEGRTAAPSDIEELRQKEYDVPCAAPSLLEVEVEGLKSFLESNEGTVLLDVREPYETPKLEGFEYLNIPLTELKFKISSLEKHKGILVFCQSGIRSATAVTQLVKAYPDKNIFQLKGGVNAWTALEEES